MKLTPILAPMLAALAVAAHAAEVPQTPPLKLPAFPTLPAPTKLTAASAGDISFATRTPYDFDLLLNRYASLPEHSGMGRLYLPAGASTDKPAPAVVVVHGSGGISPGRESEYGALLAANGYAALVIDYYRPRGIVESTPYQSKTLGVTEFDAVSDAYAALRALNAHPAVDPRRIAIVGFSYGGMASRIALDARVKAAIAPDLAPFAAHVDYYGPCFQDFHVSQTTGAPLLSLRGGEDASNDLVACAAREAQLRAAGSEVSSVIYARAGHAWEVMTPRAMGKNAYLSGCTLDYDAAGLPSVGGKSVIAADAPPARDQRAQLRMNSGAAIGECVKVGYIVGRDETTRAQSDYQLLQFLRRTLH